MSLPPVQSISQLFAAGTAVQSAATATSAKFADLLRPALLKSSEDSAEVGKKSEISELSSGSVSFQQNVSHLKAQTDAKTQSLQKQLLQLLEKNGIDLSGGLNLQLDSLGNVRVAGDHPAKAEIESLFARNDELADAFRSLANNAKFTNSLQQKTPATESSSIFAAEDEPKFNLFLNAHQAKVSFV